MRQFRIWTHLFCLILLGTGKSLWGHGVGGQTFVRLLDHSSQREAWQTVQQIHEITIDDHLLAKSYDLQRGFWNYRQVQLAGKSQTNCYYQIWFDDHEHNSIKCSPIQQFYVWVNDLPVATPAYALQPGQELLLDNCDGHGAGIAISKVEFIERKLDVYTLEVAKDHTFLVTPYCVVTHNHFLSPELSHTLSNATTEGVCVGGIAGWLVSLVGSESLSWGALSTLSWSGPVLAAAAVGGVVVFGVAYYFSGGTRADYTMQVDVPKVKQLAERAKAGQLKSCGNNYKKSGQTELPEACTIPVKSETASCGAVVKAAEPEQLVVCGGLADCKGKPVEVCAGETKKGLHNDLCLNDKEGAQAPGKPTKEDGYDAPKKWDGKKVRAPNGRGFGYPDKDGNVWVPSGPNGHGGPHWDVQSSDGKNYENIVPGGHIRGQRPKGNNE